MRLLDIKFDFIKHHFLNCAIHFSYIRNVFHRDVLELCYLTLCYHLDERLASALIELLHLIFALCASVNARGDGPIIRQHFLHKFLIEHRPEHRVLQLRDQFVFHRQHNAVVTGLPLELILIRRRRLLWLPLLLRRCP